MHFAVACIVALHPLRTGLHLRDRFSNSISLFLVRVAGCVDDELGLNHMLHRLIADRLLKLVHRMSGGPS